MTLLQLALTVQLALYGVAIVAACFCIARALGLQRQASRHGGGPEWWQTAEARRAVSHAVRPLWWVVGALIVGALAPRLMGAIHG
ncbi:hypothetical protein ARC20_17565 [Stenotrophomonas panacihumi]|uniref:Uncharacterized protein n=1 Tax=Stenotrophomonas panacihumi TaxID=676599 RepID=A0A0R0ARW2_9GAMM|nr:hypothetical protein [Stenotrophomonas panacihumi]KRG47936.1 hypothetical protein ARC20_17565 [Stenotrophomonas panacihumi]PTN53025.1 hypothetical protein C9J98_17770 [Stenotrophomonas panacihumi]